MPLYSVSEVSDWSLVNSTHPKGLVPDTDPKSRGKSMTLNATIELESTNAQVVPMFQSKGKLQAFGNAKSADTSLLLMLTR